jgi:hypothetical protein
VSRAIFSLVLAAAAAAAPFFACRKAPEAKTAAASPSAETAAERSPVVVIGGTYQGGGTTPEGRTYGCEVELIPAQQVYWVERYVGAGPMVPGVGILRGDLFVIGYRDERERYAVIAYEIKRDGLLEGTSAYQNGTKTGAETLKKK